METERISAQHAHQRPLITIIVPTFNSERTISQCLQSIVDQTYANCEVLIVDGASGDQTIQIVQAFVKKYRFIRWVSEKDAGIYDAMNKGVQMARGEWIYFLGSDDTLYSSDTLQIVARLFTGCDVVYGDVLSSRFKGRYDGHFTSDKIRQRNICHQAIFLRREVFRKIGPFDIGFRAHADWDHNLKWFFTEGIRKKYIDVIVANYADGGFSSTSLDDSFEKLKEWKFYTLNKGNLALPAKLLVIRNEVSRAIRQRRLRELRYILSGIPSFLC